mmetsp:Transcript_6334/g.18802  ORF Transcript_6334/g.18802 Transcript_6334/m.18802 type:complete len:135 (+) Transcript_6334:3648-4052(+)
MLTSDIQAMQNMEKSNEWNSKKRRTLSMPVLLGSAEKNKEFIWYKSCAFTSFLRAFFTEQDLLYSLINQAQKNVTQVISISLQNPSQAFISSCEVQGGALTQGLSRITLTRQAYTNRAVFMLSKYQRTLRHPLV